MMSLSRRSVQHQSNLLTQYTHASWLLRRRDGTSTPSCNPLLHRQCVSQEHYTTVYSSGAALSVDDTSMTRSSSSSSSSSAESFAGVVASDSTASTSAASTGPCSWYAGEECSRPRSCFDCLNAVRSDGSKCSIDAIGQCVPMAQYDASRDFRVQDATAGILSNFYPSVNTSYCSQNDSLCARCRTRPILTTSTTLSGYQYYSGLLPYCYGVDRCVCVAACEAKSWRNNIIMRASCPATSSGSLGGDSITVTPSPTRNSIFQSNKPHSGIRPATVLMVLSILGLLFLCVLVRRWWIGHNMSETLKQRRRHFAQMRLTLEGWNSHRQRLIEAEYAQLGGKPVTLQDKASTTDATPAEASEDEPAELVIERGEGYRPLSPSEYERQRRLRGTSLSTTAHANEHSDQ